MGKIIPQRITRTVAPEVTSRCKPELLSPAGDWDCVRAAVENGADAIYFGLSRFNARLRAHNFTEQDLPEVMQYLHERGVKGYVTFNTLVFTDEMPEAVSFLRSIISAGADAAIVQDVGVCRLIRSISPDFPIHASTQMSITSEAGVEFARELGCSVTVLARECSLREVAAIQADQSKQHPTGAMPLEIFVHGALCVAYSGQCLTSEALGGRSANRGECAQACRLPYELIADDQTVPLRDKRYLLSPQDLAGLDQMPGILAAGVATLKIEGRLKSPEYVAAVTSVYRKAIDRAWEKFQDDTELSPVGDLKAPPSDRYRLEMTFSRGLSTGWLNGIDNQELVHARFGKKRGVLLGTVQDIDANGIWLRPLAEMKVGDGIVFDAGRPDIEEEGARIFSMRQDGNRCWIGFQRGALVVDRIERGQRVWKTSDPALDKELRQSYEVEQPAYRRPIKISLRAVTGNPLSIEIADETGNRVCVESEAPLGSAVKQPLTEDTARKQLSRLGDTPFELESLQCELDGKCMVPVSLLNQLRRDAVTKLIQLRRTGRPWTLLPEEQTRIRVNAEQPTAPTESKPYLIPYVRNLQQLEVVCGLDYPEIYIELEDPRKYREAVGTVRRSSGNPSIWIAPPRIYKTGEDWIVQQLEKADADGLLARNHEHLRAWQGRRMRGDFSLNVANPLSAEWFKQRWQLERLTASYDLNAEQLESLLQKCPPRWFEITLHQHMPMFHMEHCVFCAFLSNGKDFRDCGRPCDTRRVELRDRVGMLHPLKADAGCRNTLFNAKAQTGAEFADRFAASGAAAFRIEFLNESPDEVQIALQRYEDLLSGKISGGDLWRKLKLINQLGVTRGTLRQ
jgi:U32 family peptidase